MLWIKTRWNIISDGNEHPKSAAVLPCYEAEVIARLAQTEEQAIYIDVDREFIWHLSFPAEQQ